MLNQPHQCDKYVVISEVAENLPSCFIGPVEQRSHNNV